MTAAPDALSDGLGVTIDDGSGPLRLVVGDAARAGASVGTGDVVTAIGPLGQRDSSGTGLAGYRLHATLAGEFAVDARADAHAQPDTIAIADPERVFVADARPDDQPSPDRVSDPGAERDPDTDRRRRLPRQAPTPASPSPTRGALRSARS